jgi:hypothetical protein
MSNEYADSASSVPNLAQRLAAYPEIRRKINLARAARGLPLIPEWKPRIDPVLIADASAALARLKAAMRSN